MSSYIQILGVLTQEKEPFGGIVDIERDPLDDGEEEMLNAVKVALQDRTKSATVTKNALQSISMYEKMPFTGTVEAFVILYCDG